MRYKIQVPVGSEVSSFDGECPGCQLEYKFNIRNEDLVNWKKGHHIKLSFPYLEPDHQSLLNNGLCSSCHGIYMKEECLVS